jgi:hypothetical protein
MSQISASASHADDHHGHAHAGLDAALAHDNVHAPGFAKGLSVGLLAVGALGCAGAAIYALGGEKQAKHALFSYHVGAVCALGLALGPLGILMIMHQVGAGWITSLRRQVENIAAMVPVAIVLLLPSAIFGPKLFKWMSGSPEVLADPLYQLKSGFLNAPFFYARLVVYAAIWLVLATRLTRLSLTQDRTGDRWLNNKAKFTSAWGLLAFALSTAFASFDLVMSLDYHWFSTMFGVYFFAGNMIASLSLVAILCALLVRSGKLKGLVTGEHFHDLGKLMLGFTVFWAYITFSQYFLYWYANIPEETAWFILRSSNGWETFGKVLIIGHFIAPFLVLLFRDVKRSLFVLPAIGLWLIAMHALDVFYMVRPIVYKHEVGTDALIPGQVGLSWVDAAGVLGPVCLLLGLLLRRVASVPLVPLKDPRLGEALDHKNYV